jgi:hypothetical protein
MKILILQVLTPDINDYSIYSIPINIDYSIKRNYDFLLYTSKKEEINYHPAWLKITSFYDIKVDKYDWIWILDVDAVINNQEIKIEDIISDCDKPIIISKNDKNGGRYLNSGSILIKSKFVKDLLLKYEDCVSNNSPFLNERFWDQELINDWYDENPEHFSVREMQELNSHWRVYKLNEEDCLKYGVDYKEPYDQQNNLIHHFMSLPKDIRIEWMRNNWINKQLERFKKIINKK